jgi:hypothetical protein
MPKRVEEIKIGFCCNCDQKILDLKQREPKKRRLENYKEHHFKLNNGSLMKIAICGDCDKRMDQAMAKHIMDRHYKTWKKEIEVSEVIPEEKKEEALSYHMALAVDSFGVNKMKFAKEKNDSLEANKEKDRQEKIDQEGHNKRTVSELEIKREEEEMEREKDELKINAKTNVLGK